MFYLIALAILTLLLFCSSYYKGRVNYFSLLFFILITLIAGLRGDVGQDTASYYTHYERLVDFDSFTAMITSKEPLLYLIMYPHKLLFNSYTSFLLLISALQSYLLYYATKSLHHRSFFLFFYLIIFFLEYHFNITRVSLAALFFLCSISVINHNKKKATVFIIASILSHLSILAVTPILMKELKLSAKMILRLSIVLLIIITPIFYLSFDIILFKIEAYDMLNFSTFYAPRLIIIILSILWISYFLSRNISAQIKFSLILVTIFYLYSGVSDIAYRLYTLTSLIFLYYICRNRMFELTTARVHIFLVGCLFLLLFLSYSSVYSAIIESDRISTSGSGNPQFTFIPYELFYDSQHR